MYAKATQLQFQPGTTEEATRIIRDIMIPSASTQQGFKGAFMLRPDAEPDKHIVTTPLGLKPRGFSGTFLPLKAQSEP